ncbi:MAG: polysaccharide biosynthesis/export family protein [Proteobacteria bacterium]|nr:polysaccharide biosynthesis/export family protein [Pseudomonadota bacterium]
MAAILLAVNPADVRAQNLDDSPDAAVSDDLSLEALEATLPQHLRTPLPIKPQKTANSDALDVAAGSMDEARDEASTIEAFYRKATDNEALSQFGYGFFGSLDNMNAPAAGTVQDDYILGAGDRITLSFLGERKDKNTYTIDQSGSLSAELLPPFAASGKTLGDLRRDIRSMLDLQAYHGDVFVSLESVRQLGVLVAGHVEKPGRQSVTPLQTVLEAIENAGGVLKTGSLRQIKLVRAGKTIPVDLYEVIGSKEMSIALPTLRDGDRIIVPPLGPTIAVTGDVRQPAIYELGADGMMPVHAAITLAGGFLSDGQNRVAIMTPQSDGRRTTQMISATSSATIGDGAILAIGRTDDRMAGSFILQGETRSAGTYPLSQYPKLSKLLRRAETFGDDVYPLMAVISRRGAGTLARELVAFSPQDIYTGVGDMTIADGDVVHLFSRADIHEVLQKKSDGEIDPLIATFIREHAVSIQGAVRLPGLWPVAGTVAAAKLLDVAGGPLRDADLTRAEISRNDVGLIEASLSSVSRRDVVNLSEAGAEGVTVGAGDAVRIPDRFEAVTRQTVTLFGEVRTPGTYDLMRGDTLLSLIDRAGGLTDEAYPLGTVFSRAAERRREKEKFASAARDLERAIALAAQGEDGKVDMAQISLAKELADELKTIEPVGRITVEGDPAVLRRDPAQDILLEAGDKIYVPKRPLNVRVTGEVLSPAALQFKADKKTDDYIAEAGGMTLHADTGRMFVLYPNGAAQPLSASQWTRIKPVMITPGSTIVVPRDPKPFDFIESAKDITQILSNLAITGIYAEDLVDRN